MNLNLCVVEYCKFSSDLNYVALFEINKIFSFTCLSAQFYIIQLISLVMLAISLSIDSIMLSLNVRADQSTERSHFMQALKSVIMSFIVRSDSRQTFIVISVEILSVGHSRNDKIKSYFSFPSCDFQTSMNHEESNKNYSMQLVTLDKDMIDRKQIALAHEHNKIMIVDKCTLKT